MPKFCRGLIAVWLVVVSFFLFDSDAVFASDNLLTNADFEDWDSSGPVGWQKSASSNFVLEKAAESVKVKSGSSAALLKLTTSNYRYLSQSASVSGATSYRFSGFFKILSGTASAFLRLAWYCQGCTSQLSTDDSTTVENINSDFSEVSLEVTSPANAATAKARIMIVPATGSNDNQILVDNLFLIPVNQNSGSQGTATQSAMTIDWSTGSEYKLGEDFGVNTKLSGFDANTQYYLKIRGGTEESSLNKAQTKNNSVYLADTESWTKFPLIMTNQDGNWAGQIFGLVSEDKTDGIYKIRIRAHKRTTDTSFDSSVKEIKLAHPVITETAISSSSTTKSGTLGAKDNNLVSDDDAATTEGDILGTSLMNNVDLILPLATASSSIQGNKPGDQSPTAKRDFVLIVTGLVSFGLSLVPWLRKIVSRVI